jgi:hypothetical protein
MGLRGTIARSRDNGRRTKSVRKVCYQWGCPLPYCSSTPLQHRDAYDGIRHAKMRLVRRYIYA